MRSATDNITQTKITPTATESCGVQSLACVAGLGTKPVTLAATVVAVAVAAGSRALTWTASATGVTGEVSVPGVCADVLNALIDSETKVLAASMTGVAVAVSADLDISVAKDVVAAVAMALKLVVTVWWCVDALSGEVFVVFIKASRDVVIGVVPVGCAPVLTATTVLKFVASAVSENVGC